MPPCGDVALYGASSNQRVYLMSTDSNSVHDDTSNDAELDSWAPSPNCARDMIAKGTSPCVTV